MVINTVIRLVIILTDFFDIAKVLLGFFNKILNHALGLEHKHYSIP